MKKTKTYYWILTALLSAFMLFSAIPDIMAVPEAVKMVNGELGYPVYLIRFLGVAKLLGAIVILIPNLNRLKEWAYAGLFFDLAGATYSIIAVHGIAVQESFMILPIAVLFLSYYLWHKLEAGKVV